MALTFDISTPKPGHFIYISRSLPTPNVNTLGSFIFELYSLVLTNRYKLDLHVLQYFVLQLKHNSNCSFHYKKSIKCYLVMIQCYIDAVRLKSWFTITSLHTFFTKPWIINYNALSFSSFVLCVFMQHTVCSAQLLTHSFYNKNRWTRLC